ncbi:AAA family ATPase [Sorangium sp. So ce117]|uniref:AAA family ATPase n=1 Tax=Sorangium sp. So ce117 TaxID=3133277 RepID=UPI003F60577D
MKILSLDLLRYGPFTGLSLDFSANPRALHVIFGSNAVGKSTTLRAVLGFLFEMPKDTQDAHDRDYKKLRVGALLAAEDGRTLQLVRRKGLKQTLLDTAEQPMDERQLQALLGGVTEEQYKVMFGLSHEALVDGGVALLKGGGDLGESLFAAGLGGTRVHAVLEKLDAEAEEIFTPLGKHKKKLNAALESYKSAKKGAADRSQPAKEWEQLQKDLADGQAHAATLARELSELQAKQRRLSRMEQALVPIAERDRILGMLKEHEGAVFLSETAPEARRKAESTLAETEPREERLGREIADLTAQMERLPVPEALLAQGASITAIQDGLGNHKKAAGVDLPRLRGELRQIEDTIESLLGRLGRRVPVEEVGSLAVAPGVEARVRALLKQRIGLERDLAGATKALTEAENKLGGERIKLAAQPAPVDVTALVRTHEIVQRDGDLEKVLGELRGEAKTMAARLEAELSALGVTHLSLEKVGALPVPLPETVEMFARDFAARDTERKSLANSLAERKKRFGELEREIEALRRGEEVPTEGDLATARRERDGHWKRVRQAWLGEPAEEGAAGAGLSAHEIADHHETSGRRADELSDRLRREADRVAKFATLSADRDQAARGIKESVTAAEQARTAEEAEQGRWQAAWTAAGIVPRSPGEMLAFLGRYQKLVEEKARLEEVRRREQAQRERIEGHREALAGALEALGVAAGPRHGLLALVAHAREVAEREGKAQREREAVAKEVRRWEIEVEGLSGALAGRQREQMAWAEQWSAVMLALGGSAATGIEEAEEVLTLRADLAQQGKGARELRRRIAGIERDAADFKVQVEGLARLTAPDLAGIPLEQAAAALLERSKDGETNRQLKQALEKDLKEKQQDLLATREKRRGAERALKQLMEEARAQDVSELVAAEDRSAVARKLRQDREIVEMRLSTTGGGLSVEALLEECRGTNADTLAQRLAEVERQIADVDRERTRVNEEVGQLRQRLLSMDGSDLAAEELTRAEQHLASISALVDDYARAKLAADLLRRAMEQYREKNQGPLVRRASELFARLSLGTFSGLRGDRDDQDRPMLRCVPRAGDPVEVRALSDGTRDQLFLALRVASLEQYFTKSEPLPLVLDDVLIHFDDARARAALDVLGELSQRTQILFFTHHARLVELAEATLPASTLCRHDLDDLVAKAAVNVTAP